jgi:hypothetical protein
MGALSPAREMEFRERYALLKEGEQPGDPKKAFHYGTHFSSAAIVLYYLVRLQPFSEQHVRLQSGRFDHSDRLFSTMKKSWQASSGGLSGDAAAGVPVRVWQGRPRIIQPLFESCSAHPPYYRHDPPTPSI